MAKLYEVGCPVREVQPKVGKKFTLQEAQSLVGGWVEVVHLEGDNILLCDEEGLLKEKPVNQEASVMAKRMGWKGGFLVGSVLFLKNNEF